MLKTDWFNEANYRRLMCAYLTTKGIPFDPLSKKYALWLAILSHLGLPESVAPRGPARKMTAFMTWLRLGNESADALVALLNSPALLERMRVEHKRRKHTLRVAVKKARNFYAAQPVNTAHSNGFYGSREWIVLRYEALAKYGSSSSRPPPPTLQSSGSRDRDGSTPGGGASIQVDHILPRSLFPEHRLSMQNIQVLCSECNQAKSNTDMRDWRDVFLHDERMQEDALHAINAGIRENTKRALA